MLFVFVCKLAGKAEVECGERVFLIFFFFAEAICHEL